MGRVPLAVALASLILILAGCAGASDQGPPESGRHETAHDIASAPWVAPEPAASEVGRRGDPDEARDAADRMGRQLLRADVNTDFAPVVDTGFGVAIGDRSYGDDPELVARMGTAAVRGFEDAVVVSAAKHFPNHGPATSDSHVSLPVARHDAQTIQAYDLPSFEAAESGEIPRARIEESLRRLLEVKERYDLRVEGWH